MILPIIPALPQVLLFEYPPLRRMGTKWAQWNYAAERRLIGDTADAKKSN